MKKRIKTYDLCWIEKIKKHFKELKLSVGVSLISGAIMFSLLFLFTSVFHIYYVFSFFIAYLVMITTSFFLNKKYVFTLFNPKDFHEQYYQFFIVSITGFLANLIFLKLLVEVFDVYYLLAQGAIVIIGFPLLFTFYKGWVFSHK